MSNKTLLIGLFTLLVFPTLGFGLRFFISDIDFWNFIDLNSFKLIPIAYGLQFGFIYAFISMLFMRAPVFETLPNRIEGLVQSMKLKIWHGVFLSLCAGIGEELLFRMSIQPYLGVWITSIGFVALHGYLNPFNWRFSLYGLIIMPFIILLSYGFDYFGIYFAIAAHTAYDAVLFTALIQSDEPS